METSVVVRCSLYVSAVYVVMTHQHNFGLLHFCLIRCWLPDYSHSLRAQHLVFLTATLVLPHWGFTWDLSLMSFIFAAILVTLYAPSFRTPTQSQLPQSVTNLPRSSLRPFFRLLQEASFANLTITPEVVDAVTILTFWFHLAIHRTARNMPCRTRNLINHFCLV